MAASSTSGDQPTLIYPENETYRVAPGETVQMGVYVLSDGGFGDVGVTRLELNATYNPDVLRATDVSTRPWLRGDSQTELETSSSIDNTNGRVYVQQHRSPPAGGTTGNERFATITFEVPSDAPAGNTTVQFGQSRVLLPEEFPAELRPVNATITVTERAQPSTDGDSSNRTNGDSSDGKNEDGKDTGLPVIGASVALMAGLTVAGVVAFRRAQ